VPLGTIATLIFYGRIAAVVSTWHVELVDVYAYTFNLFAIEFGALVGLFALFICRPTPFLERIRSTVVFTAILANVQITMVIATVAIIATFIFGLLRVEPGVVLTVKSAAFVIWCAIAILATCVYARTIKLIMTALV